MTDMFIEKSNRTWFITVGGVIYRFTTVYEEIEELIEEIIDELGLDVEDLYIHE